jgi:hypothetical protein
MNAVGTLSSPSVTNSRCLTLPSRTHCDMGRNFVTGVTLPVDGGDSVRRG